MRSRSGDLLRNVIQSGELSVSELTRELRLEQPDLDKLLDGSSIMSVAHQLCFATLLVERVPRLARRGYSLRAQAIATAAFRAGTTETHAQPPATSHAVKRGPPRTRRA